MKLMNKNKTTFFKIFPNANLVANELPFTVSLPKKKKNIYIYIYMSQVQVTLGVILNNITLLNIF